MPTENFSNAIVVGGGIVGLSCALALQKRGIATMLVSADARKSASWGNAGHIAVEQVQPLASMATLRSMPARLFSRGGAASFPPRDIGAWLPFGLRLLGATRPARFAAGEKALTALLFGAMPAWRRLTAEVGAPHLLREDGHFVFWETEASAAAGRRAWQGPAIGTARVREADRRELGAAASLLPAPAGLIRFEGSGQIADIDALLGILERAFVAAGGVMRRAHVVSVSPAVRLADGEMLSADAVVVAAGIGSRGLMRGAGHAVPMIAERGYHIEAPAGAWPADLPPVVFETRSMIVTRFAHALRAASFVEFGSEASPPDPRKWQRLRRHAAELGLPFDAPVSEWMGIRPTLPDYLPAIGRSVRATGLFYAFGHQHLGLTLGPLTGEMLGAIVAGEAPLVDPAPFDIERFV